MTEAYVLNDKLSDVDRDAVDAVLSQNGYLPVHGLPPDLSTIDPAIAIGVVCLPVDPSELDAVNQKVEALTRANVRVVAIWLHEEVGTLPDGIEEHGSAAIGIGSPKLPDALGGEAVWEEATGAPRPTQKTPRNKC